MHEGSISYHKIYIFMIIMRVSHAQRRKFLSSPTFVFSCCCCCCCLLFAGSLTMSICFSFLYCYCMLCAPLSWYTWILDVMSFPCNLLLLLVQQSIGTLCVCMFVCWCFLLYFWSRSFASYPKPVDMRQWNLFFMCSFLSLHGSIYPPVLS